MKNFGFHLIICLFVSLIGWNTAWSFTPAELQQAQQILQQNPELANMPEVQQAIERQIGDKPTQQPAPESGSTKSPETAAADGADVETIDHERDEPPVTNLDIPKTRQEKLQKLLKTPLTYEASDEALMRAYNRQIRQQDQRELNRFGIHFFAAADAIDPTVLPVPGGYVLSPKDSLGIHLYGATSQNFSLQVDAEGNLLIPRLGPIQVGGMTFAAARELLRNTLENAYPNSGAAITVERFSSIQVTVTGEVKAPGVYNLISLSTVKEAITAARGIDRRGSLRKIRVIRDGEVIRNIDLYQLILHGTGESDLLLQTGDVVFVGPAERLVTVRGKLQRNAVFELLPGEAFADLIELAGGFAADASLRGIELSQIDQQLERVEIKTINWPEARRLQLHDGDAVYVYPIDRENHIGVRLAGNFTRPGLREVPVDSTVGSLLREETRRSGSEGAFLPDTFMDYLMIKRVDDLHRETLLRVNPDLAIQGEARHDLALQARDEIFLLNKTFISDAPFINVTGEVVSRPGRMRFVAGMTLIDALYAAGIQGMVDYGRVQVISLVSDDSEPKISIVDLRKNPDFPLEPFSEVTFYSHFERFPTAYVDIAGEVNDGKRYPINRASTLAELLHAAGGLTERADRSRIELIRYQVENGVRQKRIINLSYAQIQADDFLLQPYDEVTVYRIPLWTERKSVTISGQVMYPGEFAIEEGETLSSLLARAGGFTPAAFVEGAVFTRAEVRELQIRRMHEAMERLRRQVTLLSMDAPRVGETAEDKARMAQMVSELDQQVLDFSPPGRISLNIPRDVAHLAGSHYDIALKDQDNLHIPSFTDTVTILGEVLNPTTVVWQPRYDLQDYLSFAGGLSRQADKKQILVIQPNGTASHGDSQGTIRGLLSRDPVISKGTTIVALPEIRTVRGLNVAKDITAIIYQLAVSAASLKTLGAL